MQDSEPEAMFFDVVGQRTTKIRNGLLGWAKNNFRSFPWRQKRNPYSVLVAEILLRRTTASAVSKIFETFMSQYPDIEAIEKADKVSLEKLLLKIGYNKQRANILKGIAKYVIDHYNRQIPQNRKELLEIPHVGDYTANAILSLGYGVPTAMVDSNVIRIINRLFMKHMPKKSSLVIIQKIANMLATEEDNQLYNLALLDFGALICTYGTPKCKICPFTKICDYYLEGNPSRE